MKIFLLLVFLWANPVAAVRLISTSPAITEFVFELGLGKNLVGVSHYCNYPNAALKITKIGTALHLDYEAVLKLRPDWVFVQTTQDQKTLKSLEKLNLKFMKLNFDSLDNILESSQKMGAALDRKEKSKAFLIKTQNLLNKLPRINHLKNYILVIGSQLSFGAIKTIRLAGTKTHFNDILTLSGLNNLAKNSYPSIVWDQEKIIQANPERVFLIFSDHISKQLVEKHLKAWEKMKNIDAVKKEKIEVIHGNFAVIPGPRISQLIKKFGDILSR